jgi:hypothetical protein
MHPFMELARDAVVEMGIPLADDVSSGQEGAGFVDQNIVKGPASRPRTVTCGPSWTVAVT